MVSPDPGMIEGNALRCFCKFYTMNCHLQLYIWLHPLLKKTCISWTVMPPVINSSELMSNESIKDLKRQKKKMARNSL